MKLPANLLRPGLVAVLLVCLTVPVSEAKIVKWKDAPQDRQDLFLLGFGELTMHMLDVTGGGDAVQGFESANPNLKDGISSNYRFSLFANGHAAGNFLVNGAAVVDSRIGDEYRVLHPSAFRLQMSVQSTEPIWDTWRFTGRGLYDPARQWELANLDSRLLTQPQEPSKLELLVRMESDDHGLIEGGSIRPSFKNARFTLHQRSLFGAYADLHGEHVGVEAVGGKLEGKSFREGEVNGVRADGTSGPFLLAHAPVTRASESVKVQSRDRFDTTTVISTRSLVRDVDYTVDYLLGKILLHRPVESETISGDPVYIVITYDYQREDNDDLYGGRVSVSPAEELTVSGSILHRNLDDGSTGDGVAEPEDLLAADLALKLGDHTTGYAEVAGSENPDDTDGYSALRVGGKTQAVDNLTLVADYQRLEDQFRSFTNSDLNPNKNQSRFKVGGDYDLTSDQKLDASYTALRTLESMGEFNRYDGLRNEDIYAAGYKNKLTEQFGFGLRYERRNVKDRQNDDHEDFYQNRAMANVGGSFEDFGPLGMFGYRAEYERIMFRNQLTIGENDANTNQMALTLTSSPNDRTDFKLAHRFTARKDRVLDLYDDRQDATFASARLQPHKNLNSLTTYEYKRYTVPGESLSLWQGDPTKTQWAGTFALEYLPLDKVKAFGKFGRRETRQRYDDSITLASDNHLLGQVTYFHTHHLSFDAESELTTSSHHGSVRERDKEWTLGLKMNWNRDRFHELTAGLIRRRQLSDHPDTTSTYEKTEAVSYILLLSGGMSLTERIFARGSVKQLLLRDPLDDDKTYTSIEVGYDSHDWYRFSVGFERIESEAATSPELDYVGQGLFVRFTGKM
jgi:hypothetical protein